MLYSIKIDDLSLFYIDDGLVAARTVSKADALACCSATNHSTTFLGNRVVATGDKCLWPSHLRSDLYSDLRLVFSSSLHTRFIVVLFHLHTAEKRMNILVAENEWNWITIGAMVVGGLHVRHPKAREASSRSQATFWASKAFAIVADISPSIRSAKRVLWRQQWLWTVSGSAHFFRIKLNIFWMLWSRKYFFR